MLYKWLVVFSPTLLKLIEVCNPFVALAGFDVAPTEAGLVVVGVIEVVENVKSSKLALGCSRAPGVPLVDVVIVVLVVVDVKGGLRTLFTETDRVIVLCSLMLAVVVQPDEACSGFAVP